MQCKYPVDICAPHAVAYNCSAMAELLGWKDKDTCTMDNFWTILNSYARTGVEPGLDGCHAVLEL